MYSYLYFSFEEVDNRYIAAFTSKCCVSLPWWMWYIYAGALDYVLNTKNLISMLSIIATEVQLPTYYPFRKMIIYKAYCRMPVSDADPLWFKNLSQTYLNISHFYITDFFNPSQNNKENICYLLLIFKSLRVNRLIHVHSIL